MLTIILIHGALFTSQSWNKVVPHLEKAGHKVVAVNLPGRSGDGLDPRHVTLHTAVEKVGEAIRQAPGKVVLVGHSQGGLVISQAAEAYPEKIEKLVYLAALLPRNGENLGSLVSQDKESLIGPNLEPDEKAGVLRLKQDADFREIFVADISAEAAAIARTAVVAEPIGIGATPVQLSAERFGRIPRVYIETLKDRTVTPWLQRKMYEATPVERVLSLDASHSPFLSVPEELAKAITEAL